MEECQILRSREAIQLHAIARNCMAWFPDIMLTGPRVMDIDTKICKRLDDFNNCAAHGGLPIFCNMH